MPLRVVSLVPSITQTLFALGLDETHVVGRTAWCIHPSPQVKRVKVVGGTKTPKLRQIQKLRPDVVILEREENTREFFDELTAAGVRTWVTHVTRVAQVCDLLIGLGELTERRSAAQVLVEGLRAELAMVPPVCRDRVIPLIWHTPLMAIAANRYGGDLLRLAGFEVPNLALPHVGYPVLTPDLIGQSGATALFLSSEPHPFTQAEGDAVAQAVAALGFARPIARLVDGQALTWFGAQSADALRYFRNLSVSLSLAQA